MTVAAIIEPMTLLGAELRQASEAYRDVYKEIRFLSFDSDSVGTVAEGGGMPALVQAASEVIVVLP